MLFTKEERLLNQFALLKREDECLPDGTYFFVADGDGNVCYFAGKDDFGFEYPCLVKYIEDKERKSFFQNSEVGRCGIYECVGERGRFIAVEPVEDGNSSCTVVDITEKNCDSMEQYLELLMGNREFLDLFERKFFPGRVKLPHREFVEGRISATGELIELCRGGYAEDTKELTANSDKLLEKISKICGMFSCRLCRSSSENEIYYVSVHRRLLKAILYTVAFLSRNGKDGIINVFSEKSENTAVFTFVSEYKNAMYSSLYFGTVIKMLSNFGDMCSVFANDEKITMTARLPLCTKEKLKFTDFGEADEAVDEAIFSDVTLDAFGMISGNMQI